MTEPDLDTDKLDDAALAILSLTLHDGNRAVTAKGTTRPVGYKQRAQRLLEELRAAAAAVEL